MAARAVAFSCMWAAAGRPCGGRGGDVAVAAALDMGWPQLRGLVASFRHFADPCATLALLVSATSSVDLLDKLKDYRVTAILVDQTWPYLQISELLPRSRLLELIPPFLAAPSSKHQGSIVLLRHLLSEAWLEAVHPEAAGEEGRDLLLLVDSADVLFQADPFQAAGELRSLGEAWIFEEHPWRTIAGCEFNMLHLRTFGASFREQSAQKTVVNSGVILGARDAVLAVVGAMRRLAILFEGQELNDQGILNYITREPTARSWRPAGLWVIPHGRGPVRNVGPELFPGWQTYDPAGVLLGTDSEGWLAVLDAGGTPAPILHQYNRNQRLSTVLLERWGFQRGRGFHGDAAECRSVQELEVRLAVKQHNARDELALSQPCSMSSGCCRKRWEERKRKLLWASGGGTTVLGTDALLANLDHCKSFGQTTAFLLSTDLVGWALRVAEEAEPGRTKALMQFAARWELFKMRGRIRLEEAPRPFGLQQSWQVFFLCLDEACLAEREDEVAAVAWETAAAFLRFESRKTPWIHAELQALGGGPGPGWRRLWEIAWADGQQPSAAANDSAAVRRLRFRRPQGR